MYVGSFSTLTFDPNHTTPQRVYISIIHVGRQLFKCDPPPPQRSISLVIFQLQIFALLQQACMRT